MSAEASDTTYIREQINQLCAPAMQGRGYVNNGQENAAAYISSVFKQLGLRSFAVGDDYYQPYSFSVNTFPGALRLRLNRMTLVPGADYLVDAASTGTKMHRQRVEAVDLSEVKDSLGWAQLKAKLAAKPPATYLLTNADSFSARMGIPIRRMGRQLPKGVYLIPNQQKPIWPVARDTVPATVFYLVDSIMPRKLKRVSAEVEQVLLKDNPARNVIGYVPGTEAPDSFIVVCAHYDHIGRMGEAVFPGANDNASGTAFLMALARYYASHPQRYSIAFMAFSGEEAGLLGSKYYVENPLFPLSSIRFLINVDMMADAEKGITVVNATEHPDLYELMKGLNADKSFVPDVVSRGKTANSDHHFFAEKGVPAFFLYGNGGPGHYHDIFDKPSTISLKNVDGVMKLVQEFITALQ